MTRKLLLAAALLTLIGAALIGYALTLPVYTDFHAPARLAAELKPEQVAEWYPRLRTFETPHKAFFNWGQGFLSFGLALAAAIGVTRLFLHSPRFRNFESFFIAWNVLWLLRFPATIYFHALHQSWQEYPVWADWVGPTLSREFTAWITGALVTNAFLIAFVLNRRLPEKLEWIRPTGYLDWIRISVLLLWILLLAVIAFASIPAGDVGGIVTGVLASALLLLLVAAPQKT